MSNPIASFNLGNPAENRRLAFGPDAPPPAKFTEKHRPARLADVIGQGFVSSELAEFASNPYPTAFTFFGPTGVGKTTVANALANEIGAIPDAGLFVLKSGTQDAEAVEKVLDSCRYTPFPLPGASGWKLVIVDEADWMSAKAKQIWLSALEDLPPKTVIVFTSNHPEKFEPRFLDRTTRFDFESRADVLAQDIQTLADHICAAEGLDPVDATTLDGIADADGVVSFRRVVEAIQRLALRRPRAAAVVADPTPEPVQPTPDPAPEPTPDPAPTKPKRVRKPRGRKATVTPEPTPIVRPTTRADRLASALRRHLELRNPLDAESVRIVSTLDIARKDRRAILDSEPTPERDRLIRKADRAISKAMEALAAVNARIETVQRRCDAIVAAIRALDSPTVAPVVQPEPLSPIDRSGDYPTVAKHVAIVDVQAMASIPGHYVRASYDSRVWKRREKGSIPTDVTLPDCNVALWIEHGLAIPVASWLPSRQAELPSPAPTVPPSPGFSGIALVDRHVRTVRRAGESRIYIRCWNGWFAHNPDADGCYVRDNSGPMTTLEVSQEIQAGNMAPCHDVHISRPGKAVETTVDDVPTIDPTALVAFAMIVLFQPEPRELWAVSTVDCQDGPTLLFSAGKSSATAKAEERARRLAFDRGLSRLANRVRKPIPPRPRFSETTPRPEFSGLSIGVKGQAYGLEILANGVFRLSAPNGNVYDVSPCSDPAAANQGYACDCEDHKQRHAGNPSKGCKHANALREVGLISAHNPEPGPDGTPEVPDSGRKAKAPMPTRKQVEAMPYGSSAQIAAADLWWTRFAAWRGERFDRQGWDGEYISKAWKRMLFSDVWYLAQQRRLGRIDDANSGIPYTPLPEFSGTPAVETLPPVAGGSGEEMVAVHPWQEKGLGMAPFRFRTTIEHPSKSLQEANPDAYNYAAGIGAQQRKALGLEDTHTCQACYRDITVAYVIESADGKRFVVGCECVLKTEDTKLITRVEAAKRERNRKSSRKRSELKREERRIQAEADAKVAAEMNAPIIAALEQHASGWASQAVADLRRKPASKFSDRFLEVVESMFCEVTGQSPESFRTLVK